MAVPGRSRGTRQTDGRLSLVVQRLTHGAAYERYQVSGVLKRPGIEGLLHLTFP